MSTKLSRDRDTLKSQFYKLYSPQSVAAMLDVKYSDLIYYLYRLPFSAKYATINIPKRSGGTRRLHVPISPLKIIQHKLFQVLEAVYQPRHSVHGFVKGKSNLTNAEAHFQYKRRTYVLNIDIEDFFPSINFGRVRGMFIAPPYNRPEKVATVLAQICCANNQLPQGAPTSPIIANMICSKLDRQLEHLAREHRCFYTRYADDMTFSTSRASFPRALARVVDDGAGRHTIIAHTLSEIIQTNGFKLNEEKVRLQSADRRQEITGITVNKVPNVPRKFINQIRAMLNAWENDEYEKAELEHINRWRKSYSSPYVPPTKFASVVRGKIEYLGMVRGEQNRTYRRFLNKLQDLDPDFKKAALPDMREHVFVSYSHKDSHWLELFKTHFKPLERTGELLSWDDTRIKSGTKWRPEIEQALNSARAALLLVSPNFLASDFIAQHELPPLLKAAETEGLKIFWVAVSHSVYKRTPIGAYQAAHNIDQPLDSLSPSEVNRVLVNVCELILAEFAE